MDNEEKCDKSSTNKNSSFARLREQEIHSAISDTLSAKKPAVEEEEEEEKVNDLKKKKDQEYESLTTSSSSSTSPSSLCPLNNNKEGNHSDVQDASTAAVGRPAGVGAYRVSGMYSHNREDSPARTAAFAALDDFEEYDTESQQDLDAVVSSATTISSWSAQASIPSPISSLSSITSSSSSSYWVEATTVPELVSARAILMPPITEEEIESLGSDEISHVKSEKGDASLWRRHRCLFLAVALLVAVIVALAVGVALGKNLPENNNNSSGTMISDNGNVTSRSSNNTNVTLLHAPTSSPTSANNNNNAQIFLTTLDAHRCDSGYMFDITAKTNLKLLSLHVNMNTETTQPIELWTKQGPYHGFEFNQSSWELLGQANVTPTTTSTSNHLVPLPRDLFSSLSVIPHGEQRSIYITSAQDQNVICFQISLQSLIGFVSYESVAYNTTYFDLHVGTGAPYRFAGIGKPSIFSGILEYLPTDS